MLKRFILVLLSIFLIIGCCSCNTDKSGEKESETAKPDKFLLSGETTVRIVYAKDTDSTQAKKVLSHLKGLNQAASESYVLADDSTAEDDAPEILVGYTNRTASNDAKNSLSTYLDFTIHIDKNKIAIYANTDERLSAAVKYFTGELVKEGDSTIYYPSAESYKEKYTSYTLPSLSINGTDISKYSIIRSESASDTEKRVASDLYTWIAENTGHQINLLTDAEPATENEIIIGKTNRAECASFTEAYAKNVYYQSSLVGSKILIYAGEKGSLDAALSSFKSKLLELKGDVKSLEDHKVPGLMKNKKAIFIGNSFIYWGGCVTFLKDLQTNETIRENGGDKGYFNEICKANGINMSVHNYTYGGQNLKWIYEKKLQNKDKAFLESFDYVFISEAGENNAEILSIVDKISALFPKAEEIVYLAHANTFSSNHTNIINALPKFSKNGIKVVAWGALVTDVYGGKTTVPGATLKYNKNSFIKNSSGDIPLHAAVTSIKNTGDSFHQNPLSGYITAQMCFSAITGTLCEGQKYDFCWDKSIAPQYDFQNFVECHYNNNQTTNFVEIFNSPADMLGIQKLMDVYMNKYN
ncbi:MAG: hypothetical protein J6U68_02985 [Clostridia bacterium]|nr:hypothetical protein [Clostridia bacterium]